MYEIQELRYRLAVAQLPSPPADVALPRPVVPQGVPGGCYKFGSTCGKLEP